VQGMSMQSLLVPFLLAVAMNLGWRYLRPTSGQTIWFLCTSSMLGSAVGVFAGLLLGGAEMAGNFYWTYVALPLVAAALTTRLQELVIDWTAENEREK